MVYSVNKNFKDIVPFSVKLYFLLRINKIEAQIRKIIRIINSIANNSQKNSYLDNKSNITDFIDKAKLLNSKKFFHENSYVYLDDIFTNIFHNHMIDNWPKKYILRPPFGIEKNYDTGFIYRKDTNINQTYHKNYLWIKQLNDLLGSDEFINLVNNFTNQKLYYENFTLNCTRSGSYVPLHLDDVDKEDKFKESINFVFVIKSSGKNDSANLSLSKSNKWEDVFFKSSNNNNSVLIYKIGYDNYHGFKPVKINQFRHAFTARFLKK